MTRKAGRRFSDRPNASTEKAMAVMGIFIMPATQPQRPKTTSMG